MKEEAGTKVPTLKSIINQILSTEEDVVFTNTMIFKKLDKLSFESKYSHLVEFYDFDEFSRNKTRRKNTKEKKTNMYNTDS